MRGVQPEADGHLGVEEAAARPVGLDPLAIDDELGNGALAHMRQDFVGGAGSFLNVDVGVGDVVGFEKALGLAAITTPGG